jgi:hypothetical protein
MIDAPKLLEKIKKLAHDANDKGIPIPLARDNRSGRGSYTLTMFWISFNVSILTLLGKVTNVVGDVEYSNVLWLLGITGSLYMGRMFRKDGDKFEILEKIDEQGDK